MVEPVAPAAFPDALADTCERRPELKRRASERGLGDAHLAAGRPSWGSSSCKEGGRVAEEELVAALAVRTAMGSQEATPAAEARMVAEAAMEVVKVAQQALTPCQARNNADGQGTVS